MPGEYERLFLQALAWTLLFEVPVVVLALRAWPGRPSIPWPRALAAAVVPTVLTLPYLWFLGPYLCADRTVLVVVGEALVFLLESPLIAVLAGVDLRRAAPISLAANLVSYLAGVVFHLP